MEFWADQREYFSLIAISIKQYHWDNRGVLHQNFRYEANKKRLNRITTQNHHLKWAKSLI
jgi:hypothetical protein